MPLYLDEIVFNANSVEELKQRIAKYGQAHKEGSGSAVPKGVRLVAGPWYSNEEFKRIVILDIDNHPDTLGVFYRGIASGQIKRRRLTPIVDEAALEKLGKEL